MARYIDADALKLDIDMSQGARITDLALSVIRAVQNAPAADVAPRAEVEELIYKLECLLCHATGGKLSKHTYDLRTMETVVTDYINESYSDGVEDGYKSSRAEVAREIFEEIETLIKNQCLTTTDERGIKGYVDSTVHFALAELKKKYTEQKEMKNETQSD